MPSQPAFAPPDEEASRVRECWTSDDRLERHKLTPCHEDWIALDLDVSPFDNSGTKKQGVSWTYKKVDGYRYVAMKSVDEAGPDKRAG